MKESDVINLILCVPAVIIVLYVLIFINNPIKIHIAFMSASILFLITLTYNILKNF